MEEAALKLELHDKIEHADSKQLREIYNLVAYYFDSPEEEGWDRLSEYQQAQILKGLAEAEAGLGRPYHEVTAELRKKHGLDG
jgi:hypothetical protein